MKDYKERNNFFLSTTFGNASFSYQKALKHTTKTGLLNGYIKQFANRFVAANALARSRIVTHINAASFLIKAISYENTNILFSNNY